MQLAGSFFDQDIYARKTSGSGTTPWSKLYSDRNFDLLGKDIGISWAPFQNRLLATKSHSQNDRQPLIDFQVNTWAGPNSDVSAVGTGVSILSRAVDGTRYGQFGLLSLIENYSRNQPGQPELGHAAIAPYTQQKYIDSCSTWAIAAEFKEEHGLPNPINSSLGAEIAGFATGTDNNNRRSLVFLPANKLNPTDGVYTEYTHGIFMKALQDVKIKMGMLFEGSYGNILKLRSVNAAVGLDLSEASFSGSAIRLPEAGKISFDAYDLRNIHYTGGMFELRMRDDFAFQAHDDGWFRFANRAGDPTAPEGSIYYDTNSGRFRVRDRTGWHMMGLS
jgi:hypothetical protein